MSDADQIRSIDLGDDPVGPPPTEGQQDQIRAVIRAAAKSYVDAELANKADLSGGTVPLAQIPALPASKITEGVLEDTRIPSLNANKINAGMFAEARIPSLPASKITSETFADARIPALNASKINAGVFADARIPSTVARSADVYSKSETASLLTNKADLDPITNELLIAQVPDGLRVRDGVYVASASADASIKAIASFVCDGTADDIEINSAISLAASLGVPVLLSSGTFTLADSIVVAEGTQLHGEGDQTVLTIGPDAYSTFTSFDPLPGFTGHGPWYAFIRTDAVTTTEGVTISDIAIDGNGANNAGKYWIGICTYLGVGWVIERCRIHSMTSSTNRTIRTFSILNAECEDISITNNRIGPGGDYDCVAISGGSERVRVVNNRIEGEGISDNAGICIQIANRRSGNVRDIVIANNELHNPNHAFVTLHEDVTDTSYTLENVSIANNVMVGTSVQTGMGIHLVEGLIKNVSITGNVIEHNRSTETGTAAIWVQAVLNDQKPSNVTISGNSIRSKSIGIAFGNWTDGSATTFIEGVTICGNTIESTNRSIQLGSSSRFSIIGNTLRNLVSGGNGGCIFCRNSHNGVISGNSLYGGFNTIGFASSSSKINISDNLICAFHTPQNPLVFLSPGIDLVFQGNRFIAETEGSLARGFRHGGIASHNITIRDNDFSGLKSPQGGNAGIIDLPAGSTGIVAFGNIRYKTEAQGTATVASSGTSVTVSHGLSYTPSVADFQLTPTSDTGGLGYWVSAATSSTFTITLSGTAATDIGFAWRSEPSI